jgi:hypothetical protein
MAFPILKWKKKESRKSVDPEEVIDQSLDVIPSPLKEAPQGTNWRKPKSAKIDLDSEY